MIPRQNLKNLMLRAEVVEAVQKGKFHIYAVGNIDEGVEVLTGAEAGKRGKAGTYPAGSINHKVDKQLKEMANRLKAFYGPPAEEKKEERKTRR